MTSTAHVAPAPPPTPHDPGAHHQLGLFSRDDVRRLGLSDDTLRWRRRTGEWIRVRHNAYVTAERWAQALRDPVRAHALDAAAVLHSARSGDTVISHRSAAVLHRLPLIHRWPERVVVTVERRRRSGLRDVEERTTRLRLPPEHVTDLEGIRLTSAGRTAIDVVATSSRHEGIVILDAVLARGLVTKNELRGIADSRSVLTTPRATVALLELADGHSPDPITSLARLALHEHGIPLEGVGVMLQRRAGAPPLRVPLLWPHARVAAIHRGDHEGFALLRSVGITPFAMDADMVLHRAAEFSAVMGGLLERRRSAA